MGTTSDVRASGQRLESRGIGVLSISGLERQIERPSLSGLALLAVATAALASGTMQAVARGDAAEKSDRTTRMTESGTLVGTPQKGERLTVRGKRLAVEGVGVECPRILGEDGRTYSVSYLAPSVAVGDRVEVTGTIGNMPTCLGDVLRVEDVLLLQDG